MQCLESIVQKVQGGVVIKFEKVGPDPPPIDDENADPSVISNASNGLSNSNSNGKSKEDWTSCRKLIYVQRSAQKGYSVGHWPIPEAFWPDINNLPSLPPRSAHPLIKFTCTNSEPMIIDNLPFDKYELEPSPLTQAILARKQPNVAWQCFVSGSHKNNDLGFPFGYLKASTTLNCVNLFVMPYNYPTLLPLLDELFKVHHCKPSKEWKSAFDNYLKMLPLYYMAPLKRALQRMGAPALVPDNLDMCLSYTVSSYLKKLKNQAKAEFDKMVMAVSQTKPQTPDHIRVVNAHNTKKTTEVNLQVNKKNSRFDGLASDLNDFSGFQIRLEEQSSESRAQCYRNAFDITRHELIDQIQRMRSNFMQPPGECHTLATCDAFA